ncbi:4'-phosphopantetheinyl transferase family protein [Streptomyces sp. NPDC015139]|uniref:4'-phosphopantetheinyl transferase family protein n=1 Tax=Streptomyces sp. NPDC015139 TaxID=3364942 RepID=UPI0036FE8559
MRRGVTPLLAVAPADSFGPVRAALARYGDVAVHADAADWAVDREEEAALWAGAERGRLAGPLPAPVRQRLVASRRLVRCVAGAVLGVDPLLLELTRDPGGRPRLRGYARLQVSLSHTGSRLVLALGAGGVPVGVDVERADRPVRVETLAGRICTPHERAVLAGLPPAARPAVLLRLWTLKEAHAKALGAGLRLPFTGFGFRLLGRTAVLTDDRGRPVRPVESRFTTHLTGTGHLVSVAAGSPAG